MILQYYQAYLLFEEEAPQTVPSAVSPSGTAGRPKLYRISLEQWYSRRRKAEIQRERRDTLVRKLKEQQAQEVFAELVCQGIEQRRKAALWTTVLAEV